MNILVVNSGSSSIKYRLIDIRTERMICEGQASRIGEAESPLLHRWYDEAGQVQELRRSTKLLDQRHAMRALEAVWSEVPTTLNYGELSAVGHRVVHGGDTFRQPARIDTGVVASIRHMCTLAPLHNPANLTGIEFFLETLPHIPQVAVFDTAFHQTIPEYAYRYAIPGHWYREQRVRRYGFHGTSHAWLAGTAAKYLKLSSAVPNIITLHLGNGASAAAIRGGKCIDTSMGFTPLEGLIMGTRSGDIDPAILFHISRQTGSDPQTLEIALNQQSGLKGICGANDMRDIEQRAATGDTDARLAIEMYCYRIKKYIGAYHAVLGHLDALVFSAGIGENSSTIRKTACEGLECLGILIDGQKNERYHQGIGEIQADTATVKVLVIPTDEELEIARQTAACIERSSPTR